MVVMTAILCVLVILCLIWRALRTGDSKVQFSFVPALLVTAALVSTESYIDSAELFPDKALAVVLMLQALQCPAWMLFSLCYGRACSWKTTAVPLRMLFVLSFAPVVMAALLPMRDMFYLADFLRDRVIYLENLSFFFYLQLVLCMLLAAGNLESTLRGSQHSERWRVKLALVGAGTVLVTFALQYGQGLLFRQLDLGYMGLRNGGVLIGLLLSLYAEVKRGSDRVSITRGLAFRSVTVVIGGAYLIGLGVAREGVRLFGAGFERQMAVGIIFAMGLVLLLVLLSERLRRRMHIWLHRTFYNEKYDYRRQWLDFTGRLSHAGNTQALVSVMLREVCHVFGHVGAAFLPADPERKGSVLAAVLYEMDEPMQAPPGEGFSFFVANGQGPVTVKSAVGHVPDDVMRYLEAVRARLVLPIRAGEEVEGLVLLSERIDVSEEHDEEDFELMDAMCRQIGLCVRSFRLGDELALAREMEVLGRFAALVMHDLKNQVYALSLLVENARDYIHEPEFQRDMLETLTNSVTNMRSLIMQLNPLPGRDNLHFVDVDIMDVARSACSQVPGAKVRFEGEGRRIPADAEQLAKVFINLFVNAVEAGGDAPITVRVGAGGHNGFEVEDRAGGIAPEMLRGGMFRPFRTTKARGMGIGLYHCRRIIEAHGGKISVASRLGVGTTFTVTFGDAARTPESEYREAVAPLAAAIGSA